MQYRSYDSPAFSKLPLGPGSLAALMVLALFGMLPFTQYLASLQKTDSTVRQFNIAPPPPVFTPPEPPPPQEPPPQEDPPQMDTPPPQLSLSQLSMAINPGVGDALAGDFSLGNMSVSAEETMEQISLFEISDLDEAPRKMREGRMIWPPKMQRDRINGYVHLEGVIKEDGSCEYVRTVEASHPEYEEMFIRYINSLVYSAPTVNGKPVRARLTLKVPIKW